MKKIFKYLSILFIFISLAHPGFCSEIQNQNEFRFDASGDEDNIYLNRTSLNTSFDLPLIKRVLLSSVFFEPRRDFHLNRWYRIELGAEFGINICKLFYLGESLQYVWQDPGDNILEAETRLVIEQVLNFKLIPKDKTKMQLFEEYTFNMEGGEGTRNEIGVALYYDLTKYLKAGLGWRHVDRIHDYDSDQITTSITFIF